MHPYAAKYVTKKENFGVKVPFKPRGARTGRSRARQRKICKASRKGGPVKDLLGPKKRVPTTPRAVVKSHRKFKKTGPSLMALQRRLDIRESLTNES